MSWVKLDDRFYSHPKAIAAGKDGRALFLASICWSKAHLTDGHIPKGVLAMLAVQSEVRGRFTASRLVSVGLWHIAEDGWWIHDWPEWQETAEEEKARKRRDADRQKAWRDAHRNGNGTFRNDQRNALRPPLLTGHVTPPDTDTDIEVPSNSLSKGTVVAAEGWRERELPDEPTRLRVNGWNL